jgi:hypothetical protein
MTSLSDSSPQARYAVTASYILCWYTLSKMIWYPDIIIWCELVIVKCHSARFVTDSVKFLWARKAGIVFVKWSTGNTGQCVVFVKCCATWRFKNCNISVRCGDSRFSFFSGVIDSRLRIRIKGISAHLYTADGSVGECDIPLKFMSIIPAQLVSTH